MTVMQLIEDPHNRGGDGREWKWASRRTARRMTAASEADGTPSSAAPGGSHHLLPPVAEAQAGQARSGADPSEWWLPSVLINPTLVRIAKQARGPSRDDVSHTGLVSSPRRRNRHQWQARGHCAFALSSDVSRTY